MEPVIGMDVSKGNSVIQAFLRRNEPCGKAEIDLKGWWRYS
ncbi:hypothetical protein [Paenibacillus dendritiformis]|nr:hypothetical protein [Paenibacillus dendritiformis]